LDLLAPIAKEEDFSTASLMKNKGSNISIELLSLMKSAEDIIITIIKKSGLIDFERLMRITENAL